MRNVMKRLFRPKAAWEALARNDSTEMRNIEGHRYRAGIRRADSELSSGLGVQYSYLNEEDLKRTINPLRRPLGALV